MCLVTCILCNMEAHMNIEQKQTYKVKVEFAHLDAQGFIKPHGYQHIIGRVIDEHLQCFNVDFNSCLQQQVSWVVVALNVEIKKHVQGCATLYIKTWYSDRKRLHFRREIEAMDEKGEPVFVASLYSILWDLRTQSVYRKTELPFELFMPHPDFRLAKNPVFKEKLTYTKIGQRVMLRSFIDALGHVNNCRYGEFALDALAEEHTDLLKITGFDIYFCSELKLNDVVTLEENIAEKIVLHGYNETNQKTSFYCVFHLG